LIRTLIVDDEALARRRICRFLRSERDFQIVAECSTGEEAVAAIRRHAPQLVFLDVQMQAMSGLEVITSIGVERMPLTVFTTAYDEYAVRAFELHALDYLLKPFSRSRFQEVLERTRGHLVHKARTLDPRLLARLAQHLGQEQGLRRLLIKSGGRVLFLDTREVDWIQAEGNYVRVHAGAASHLLRRPLAKLAETLNPGRFVRIHRSTIVNLDRVRELRPWFHGDCVVVLRDGTELTLSRTFREQLRRLLNRDF
jgi:two-component system LytT family response regulator